MNLDAEQTEYPLDVIEREYLQSIAADLAQLPGTVRADLLRSIAAAADVHSPDLLAIASAETALAPAELVPELARMVGTLRMFADLVVDNQWSRPASSPHSTASIGPNHSLQSRLVPLGPVLVFGASNFPFAYGVLGGDTASALAAGCPVVVKEHPAHPRTGALLASIASAALRTHSSTLPHAPLISYVPHADPEDRSIPNALIMHPHIAAIGFTGSLRAGLAIDDLARTRPVPIPVFAEMGSRNPVHITGAAAAARGELIARELAASILQRFGQQCTRPGIIVVYGHEHAAAIAAQITEVLAAAPTRDMLAPWIRNAYTRRIAACASVPGVRVLTGSDQPTGTREARAALLAVTADTFAQNPVLHEEIFGPAAIVVTAEPIHAASDIPRMTGNLCCSIYADPNEPAAAMLLHHAAQNAGRVVFNGVSTGVRVAEAMVHSGPFPASNAPHTTAVGPRAIERWCRPVCFQNVPENLPGLNV